MCKNKQQAIKSLIEGSKKTGCHIVKKITKVDNGGLTIGMYKYYCETHQKPRVNFKGNCD